MLEQCSECINCSATACKALSLVSISHSIQNMVYFVQCCKVSSVSFLLEVDIMCVGLNNTGLMQFQVELRINYVYTL